MWLIVCYLWHMLEIFESYSFRKLHLVYTRTDSVLNNFMMMQIELKPDTDVSDLFHYTWNYKVSGWSSVNNLPVCIFFRKPGNMLLRRLSTCLIHGQNFILRTLRQNMPLATGLYVSVLSVLSWNRIWCFLQGLCLCVTEYV